MNTNKIVRRPSLNEELVDAIMREIASSGLGPGGKLPGMRELTQQFGVSINSLRAALLLLEERGVVTVRHGTGIFVQEQEDKRHVAILSELDLLTSTSFFHARAVQELRSTLSEHGIPSRLYIGSAPIGHEPALTCTDLDEDIKEGRVSAIAAIATPSWSNLYVSSPIPVIFCDGSPDVTYSVDLDNKALALAGVHHLLAQGRRKIAMMAWHPKTRGEFEKALAEAGIHYRPHWFASEFDPCEPGAGWAMFREIWVSHKEKPDGIVICDDVLSRDAKTAIAEMQIDVPTDLMVVTHANKGTPNHFPFPVTRLEFDPAELARQMGAMLVNILEGVTIPTPRTVVSFRTIEPKSNGDAVRIAGKIFNRTILQMAHQQKA